MPSDQPEAYRKGWVDFYKLKFAVTADVLIPRPETELLVDEVLKFIHEHPGQALTVLDLGCGAGAIAVAVAKNLPSTSSIKIIASEISFPALEIAKKNAQLHGVSTQIEFVVSDLLTKIEKPPDIIVTNLPYIPSARIAYLESSVKDFEPHLALDGGEDGFKLYRKLFQQLNQKDWQPQLIVGEIDYTHGQLAADEASKYFPSSVVEVKTDLTHKQRILLITAQV